MIESRIYPRGHNNPSKYCFAIHMHFKLLDRYIINNKNYDLSGIGIHYLRNIEIRIYDKIFD
jgi:hypothetical protein